MLFTKIIRGIAAGALALAALSAHAHTVQNTPLEKFVEQSAVCTLAQEAQAIDAPEENASLYGECAPGSTINPYKHIDPDGRSPVDVGFLVFDTVKLGLALYSGVGVGHAAADVAISALGVLSPVPGTGQAIKGLRAAEHVAEAAKVVEKGAEAARGADRAAHGNSAASTTAQHRYEIVENSTGDVVKTGISGRPLNVNGTSGRANSQVNSLNKAEGPGTYSAVVKETNIPGRQAALDAEKAATTQLNAAGNSLRNQQRPTP